MIAKKRWLLFLILLVSLTSVSAQEITVKHLAIKDTVLPGQNAEYSLSIASQSGETVSLSYSDDYWRAKIEPGRINLAAGQTYDNVKVSLFPLANAAPGNYVFKLRIVAADTNEILQEYPLNVVMADKDNAVRIRLLTPELDPGINENLMQIEFTNNYGISIDNLAVSITSSLFTYDTVLNLGPEESKREDIIVKLDKTIKEGSYDMDVKFSLNNVELTTKEVSFVVGQQSDIRRTINTFGGLFTNVREVKFVNEGNTVVRETYTEGVSTLEDLFTTTSPEPTQIGTGENRQLAWELELKPGEIKTIAITTGYKGFVILLIVLLVLIGLWYFWLGKDISITKKVVTASGDHDAFGNIRVSLHIRNRSRHRMYNVRVLDRVPGYVMPEKEEFSGARPINIKKVYGGGIVMVWNIPSIDAGSEHVVSYRVKTRLHVFGKVMLPMAAVRYRNNHGRIVQSYSNKMILFSLPSHE